MKALNKFIFAAILLTGAWTAQAEETPVFASCYSDAGEHLTLVFDTAKTSFSYRYEKLTGSVDEYEARPSGSIGNATSRVTKSIPADQNHIELKAHIVNGDSQTPIIDTDISVTFDRDATGSLKLSHAEFYHLSQLVDLSMFKAGICYVQ